MWAEREESTSTDYFLVKGPVSTVMNSRYPTGEEDSESSGMGGTDSRCFGIFTGLSPLLGAPPAGSTETQQVPCGISGQRLDTMGFTDQHPASTKGGLANKLCVQASQATAPRESETDAIAIRKARARKHAHDSRMRSKQRVDDLTERVTQQDATIGIYKKIISILWEDRDKDYPHFEMYSMQWYLTADGRGTPLSIDILLPSTDPDFLAKLGNNPGIGNLRPPDHLSEASPAKRQKVIKQETKQEMETIENPSSPGKNVPIGNMPNFADLDPSGGHLGDVTAAVTSTPIYSVKNEPRATTSGPGLPAVVPVDFTGSLASQSLNIGTKPSNTSSAQAGTYSLPYAVNNRDPTIPASEIGSGANVTGGSINGMILSSSPLAGNRIVHSLISRPLRPETKVSSPPKVTRPVVVPSTTPIAACVTVSSLPPSLPSVPSPTLNTAASLPAYLTFSATPATRKDFNPEHSQSSAAVSLASNDQMPPLSSRAQFSPSKHPEELSQCKQMAQGFPSLNPTPIPPNTNPAQICQSPKTAQSHGASKITQLPNSGHQPLIPDTFPQTHQTFEGSAITQMLHATDNFTGTPVSVDRLNAFQSLTSGSRPHEAKRLTSVPASTETPRLATAHESKRAPLDSLAGGAESDIPISSTGGVTPNLSMSSTNAPLLNSGVVSNLPTIGASGPSASRPMGLTSGPLSNLLTSPTYGPAPNGPMSLAHGMVSNLSLSSNNEQVPERSNSLASVPAPNGPMSLAHGMVPNLPLSSNNEQVPERSNSLASVSAPNGPMTLTLGMVPNLSLSSNNEQVPERSNSLASVPAPNGPMSLAHGMVPNLPLNSNNEKALNGSITLTDGLVTNRSASLTSAEEHSRVLSVTSGTASNGPMSVANGSVSNRHMISMTGAPPSNASMSLLTGGVAAIEPVPGLALTPTSVTVPNISMSATSGPPPGGSISWTREQATWPDANLLSSPALSDPLLSGGRPANGAVAVTSQTEPGVAPESLWITLVGDIEQPLRSGLNLDPNNQTLTTELVNPSAMIQLNLTSTDFNQILGNHNA